MADSSSKIVKAIFSSSKGGSGFNVGKINPRILKILGINEFDIEDESEYLSLLKEKMLLISMGKSKLSREDEELIIEEFKRLKSKKFPKKKITADSFKKGTAVGINLNVKKITGGVQPKQLLLPPAINKMSGKSDIQEIIDSLSSIIEQLTLFNNLSGEEQERNRRGRENRRRREREGELEKSFDGVMKAAEKVITPVKSILDRIINFLVMTLIGRSLILLLEWFSDKDNKDKVQAISRFLGDHWPKLLALFIAFGTGLGGFVRGLIGVVIKGTKALIKGATKLAARAGIKGAAGALKFLGGPKGRLIGAGLELAAVAGGTFALSKGIENFAGIGGENPKEEKVEFSGGGFANFKNIFGNIGGFFSGLVKGPGGPKGDKIPAMLSNGEFVVSAGAVQKYGVDTFEAMNAAGGGNNNPKVVEGTTYAAGGGLIGDIPIVPGSAGAGDNAFRRAAMRLSFNKRYGTEDDLFKAFKRLNGIPDIDRMIGADNASRISQGHYGTDDTLDAIRKSVSEKLKSVNKPQSFTQSSRAAAGLDDLANKFDMDAKTSQRYGQNLPRLGRPKPRIDPSRMLPGAGESSASAMAKIAQNTRPPIPASSAIVPYTGGGLARTGVTGGLSVPQIKTNMRVPGGFGNLKSFGAELLLSYLMQSGLDYVEAKRLASTIEKARKESPEKLANRIEKLRELVAKEERFQKSFGGILQKVIKLGGETGSEVLSRQAKTILSGLGAKTFQGGKIMGGYGLKDQSFKDAPKTQIMTDDKGRPFVGYKAMRGGKPVYVRGPQPGTGTTNPFEALGRMINPGAYKDIDAKNERKKFQEASAGNISSLKERGATQATLSREKTRLNKVVPPPAKPKVNVKYTAPAGGGMAGKRGSGSSPSTATTRVPQFSSSSRSRTRRRSASTYGIG